jgi:subtilisin-like proprotein convertase family protein
VLHAEEGGSDDDLRKSYTVTGMTGAARGGDWTLTVVDRVAQDVGTLNAWSLAVK